MALVCRKCENCGAQIEVKEGERVAVCEYCGSTYVDESIPIEKSIEEIEPDSDDESAVVCPKCGSHNICFVTKKDAFGYKILRGIIWFVILGIIGVSVKFRVLGALGLLFGIHKHREKNVRKCLNCNHEF